MDSLNGCTGMSSESTGESARDMPAMGVGEFYSKLRGGTCISLRFIYFTFGDSGSEREE